MYHRLFTLLLLCCNYCWAQTIVRNVHVVDVEQHKVLPAQDVLMLEGRIAAVDKGLKAPAGVDEIDGAGKWLMPGLVDAHIHFGQSGGIYTRPDAIDLRKYYAYEKEMDWQHRNMEGLLRRYLAAGITTVIDVGSSVNFLKQQDSFKTKTYAPEIFMTGPLLTTYQPEEFKGLGDDEMFYLMHTPEEGRALVQRQLKYKPHFIKIWYIVEGKNTDSAARASLPMVRAVIDEAHQHGLRVAVHATEQITAKLSVQAGADYLVHGVENELVDDELLHLLKKNKTVVSPTLVVAGNYWRALGQYYQPSAEDFAYAHPTPLNTMFHLAHLPDTVLARRYKNSIKNNKHVLAHDDSVRYINLKRMADAGVIIATGTDAGNIGTHHVSSYFQELGAMQEAGMSMWQLLEASTLNGAKAMNAANRFGKIAKGMGASVVLLNSDPTTSINNWKSVERVFKNGIALEPAGLRKPTALELADEQLVAYNAHNLEAFLKPYADSVKIYDLKSGKLQAEGKPAMREMYSFLNKVELLHCKLVNRIVEGSFVIDHEEIITDRGKFYGVAIYEISGDKIVRVWFP